MFIICRGNRRVVWAGLKNVIMKTDMLKAMGAALTLGFSLALINPSTVHAATITSGSFTFYYGANLNTWVTTSTNTWTAAGPNITTDGNFSFSPAPVGGNSASIGPLFPGGVLADGNANTVAAATYTEYPTGYNNQQGSGEPVPAQSLPITAQYLGAAPADVDTSNPGYTLRLELSRLSIYGVSTSSFGNDASFLQWNEVTAGHAQASSPSALLNRPTWGEWSTAANWTELAWDAPDYGVTLASLGDAVTRTFQINYVGTNPYAVIDGMAIEGRVVLDYNAVPEPSTGLLMMLGSLGAWVFSRRRINA